MWHKRKCTLNICVPTCMPAWLPTYLPTKQTNKQDIIVTLSINKLTMLIEEMHGVKNFKVKQNK